MSAVVVAPQAAFAESAKSKSAKSTPAPAAKPEAAKPPSVGGAEPTLIGQCRNIGVPTRRCRTAEGLLRAGQASSSKTNPPNRPRDPAYVFISTRPAEKSRQRGLGDDRLSVEAVESALEIGSARYAMYTQGDGLWIKNAAEEERMVDALRKGTDVTVKGVSAKEPRHSTRFP